MNDWGLPDWRDPSAYGDTKSWEIQRWRWEFYRRRKDVREYFDRHADAMYRNKCECHDSPGNLADPDTGRILQTHEPGFVVDGYYTSGNVGYTLIEIEGESFNFGYVAGLPNPRISEQPPRTIHAVIEWDNINTLTVGRGGHWAEADTPKMTVLDGEIGYIFKLDRPIAAQIKGVKESLREYQIARHDKLLQTRARPANWLIYLRVLDAREGGETWLEITDTFYAQRLLDRREDPSGGYCAPPPQAARDIWEAADALRFNF
jgi:hypothetical protein